MTEVGKAWEQYLLDTGSDLSVHNISYRKTAELVIDSGINGWNGPYLPYKLSSLDNNQIIHPEYDFIGIFSLKGNATWGGLTSFQPAACTDDIDCYIWINFHKVDDQLATKIDEIVDNGDGDSSGNFRWTTLNDSYDHRIYWKYMPYGRPL